MDISDGYESLNVTTRPQNDCGQTVRRTMEQRDDHLEEHQEDVSAGNALEKSDETETKSQTKFPRNAGEDSDWMQISGKDEPIDPRTCPGCNQVMKNDYSLVEHLMNPDNPKCHQAAKKQDKEAALARNKAAEDAWHERLRIALAPPSAERYAEILREF